MSKMTELHIGDLRIYPPHNPGGHGRQYIAGQSRFRGSERRGGRHDIGHYRRLSPRDDARLLVERTARPDPESAPADQRRPGSQHPGGAYQLRRDRASGGGRRHRHHFLRRGTSPEPAQARGRVQDKDMPDRFFGPHRRDHLQELAAQASVVSPMPSSSKVRWRAAISGTASASWKKEPERKLEDILVEVIEVAEQYGAPAGKKIPVIAAGGIFDGKDIARLLQARRGGRPDGNALRLHRRMRRFGSIQAGVPESQKRRYHHHPQPARTAGKGAAKQFPRPFRAKAS